MRQILFLFSCYLLLSSCSDKRPNFVFILVDDLGWTDLGYSGSTFYETPNIDLLSQNSIQFTNAYASASICSPSRAAILTGKHPARLNITDWIPGDDPQNEKLKGPQDLHELPLEEITMAEVLKENGYQTFFAGKWHLGGVGYSPMEQGFDVNIGGNEKGQPQAGYYSPYDNPNLSDGPDGEYLTDRLTNESIKFLDQAGNAPFFLFLSYYTVHTPIQACKRHIEKFNQKLLSLANQDTIQRNEGEGRSNLNQNNPAYASMLYALDENIGRLITKLKEKGLYQNTTIIFTSDNGGLSTISQANKKPAPTSVLPLRAGKGWLYEGGIRVPLLIKPANYKEMNKVCAEVVVGHDFYPSILVMANVKAPNEQEIDGVNLETIWKDNSILKRTEVFWHYPHYHTSGWTPGAAIRQGDWKLIEFYENGKTALYNLKDNISEEQDLSLKFPEKAIELRNSLWKMQLSMKANSAIQNPDYNSNN